MGSVYIRKILQKGQNYHGQFSQGDTLSIYFTYTLRDTEKLFPELNKALPGIKVNGIFEAELFEKPDETQKYRIELYALKK